MNYWHHIAILVYCCCRWWWKLDLFFLLVFDCFDIKRTTWAFIHRNCDRWIGKKKIQIYTLSQKEILNNIVVANNTTCFYCEREREREKSQCQLKINKCTWYKWFKRLCVYNRIICLLFIPFLTLFIYFFFVSVDVHVRFAFFFYLSCMKTDHDKSVWYKKKIVLYKNDDIL